MKIEFKKTLNMINTVLAYCYTQEATDFHVDFQFKADHTAINMEAYTKEIDSKTIKQLSKILNVPRQLEVEEKYWQMNAATGSTDDIMLIGAMTDEGTVAYENGKLTITIKRYFDR